MHSDELDDDGGVKMGAMWDSFQNHVFGKNSNEFVEILPGFFSEDFRIESNRSGDNSYVASIQFHKLPMI